jgi:hypothetical protein
MHRLFRRAALAATLALLSGCIIAQPYGPPPYAYAPAPYAYAPYAYGPAYPTLGVDIGTCFGCGRFHRW